MVDALRSFLHRHLHTTPHGAVAFGLVVAVLTTAEPTPRSLACGAVATACGLLLRLWAAGFGPSGSSLLGPSRWLRQPRQLGSALLFLGLCLAGRNAWVTAAAMIALAVLQSHAQRRVDAEQADQLGLGFAAYRVQVPSLLPRLWPYAAPTAGGFSWEQALFKGRRRELDLLLAAVFCWAVLYGLSLVVIQMKTHLIVAAVVLVSILGRFVYYAGSRRVRR